MLIKYKFLVIEYKDLHDLVPAYLHDFLQARLPNIYASATKFHVRIIPASGLSPKMSSQVPLPKMFPNAS